MSLIRFVFALLAGTFICGSAIAQSPSKTAWRSSKDQVVTDLAEHPVHAMRRRKATFKSREQALKAASPKTLNEVATELGLHGRWFVISGEKDGPFSEAQIGQQPGDVISLLPEEDAKGPLLPIG